MFYVFLDFFTKEKHSNEAMQLINSWIAESETILIKNKLGLLKIAVCLTNKMEESEIADFVMQYANEDWVTKDALVKKENYFKFNACV